MTFKFFAVGFFLLATGCASLLSSDFVEPPAWLEDNQNPKTVEFVGRERLRVENELATTNEFKANYGKILKYYEADARLPAGIVRGDYLYFLKQDKSHARGIWQRILLHDLAAKNLKWETLLDLDQLAQLENQNWIFQSAQCSGEGRRCLLALSNGGADTAVVREFDLKTKKFVRSGFELPLGKHVFKWLNENEVLLGTNFGPHTMSTSGSPRQIRVWKRGQGLEQSELRFHFHTKDSTLMPYILGTDKTAGIFFVRSRSSSDKDFLLVEPNQKQEVKLEVPGDAQFLTTFDRHAILFLRRAWGLEHPAGSIVAVSLDDFRAAPKVLLEGRPNQMVVSAQSLKSDLVLNVLNDLKSEIYFFGSIKSGSWSFKKLELPQPGHVTLLENDGLKNQAWLVIESYLQPPSLWRAEARSQIVKKVLELPAAFSESDYERITDFALSADGTKVPYTMVKSKKLKADRLNPTLVTGYGSLRFHGMETYLGALGLTWLADGGIWAFAHVRGGLELGPDWTAAAFREKRVRALEDFKAVANDISAKGWTTSKKTASFGFSKGGLLVGAAATRYPNDFRATAMRVPILDLKNFSRWPPGASWTEELGDPNKEIDANFLKGFSPLESVFNKNSLPSMLLISATGDDRVHPAHSRRMIWNLRRWQEKNQRNITSKFYYFESPEGGHSLNNNPAQRAFRTALEVTFMRFQLGHN